jgi:hypothetical protein
MGVPVSERRLELVRDKVSCMIGVPVYESMKLATIRSLTRTAYAAGRMGFDLDIVARRGVVEIARDDLLGDFIASSKRKLFCIDSDIVWEPEQFVRLLTLSQYAPVVCAAYPAKKIGAPTFYLDYEPGTLADEHGLVPIKGTGLGFCVFDRDVIEKLIAAAPRAFNQISGETTAVVHRFDINNGNRRTEDFALFADIRALGYEVKLDPLLELGHVGEIEFRGSVANAFMDAVAPANAAE